MSEEGAVIYLIFYGLGSCPDMDQHEGFVRSQDEAEKLCEKWNREKAQGGMRYTWEALNLLTD